MIEIVELTAENLSDLHKANQPFEVIGRLEIKFERGVWSYTEVLFEEPRCKQYPNYDGASAQDYITSLDRVAYLAYDEGVCIGQILLAKTWNGYAHIEGLCIARDHRGKGIGTALLMKAEQWAKKNRFCALSLECQDNNMAAARFCQKNGFAIGGVNTRLYTMLGAPYAEETAVFWYKMLTSARAGDNVLPKEIEK